eukprot:1012646-Pelagomonas_calceolata.AAC.1
MSTQHENQQVPLPAYVGGEVGVSPHLHVIVNSRAPQEEPPQGSFCQLFNAHHAHVRQAWQCTTHNTSHAAHTTTTRAS